MVKIKLNKENIFKFKIDNYYNLSKDDAINLKIKIGRFLDFINPIIYYYKIKKKFINTSIYYKLLLDNYDNYNINGKIIIKYNKECIYRCYTIKQTVKAITNKDFNILDGIDKDFEGNGFIIRNMNNYEKIYKDSIGAYNVFFNIIISAIVSLIVSILI